jgi:transcriptional regulator with XRE-family HTH domain
MAAGKSFGMFFRSSRKAMGLSLREFCRRNGFDPANISRLERGLVPPPQSRQIMESYAKALKIDKDTAAWDRFFELAATGAGRIPDEFLEDQQAVEKLPRLFRKLRPGGQRPGWVRALHLEAWADTVDSRTSLPQLARRLIRATGKDLRRIEFPANEQVQRPGWDGIVEASNADVYVPAGTSVWEMGVEKNPQKKAEEDFVKRTKDPLGLDRQETTFVFVTPRKWQKKDEWCQAKAKLGAWREVRVYDSATLEEWLEQAPAVDAWLAGMLGIKPDGLTVLDEYWANLQALTAPSLKPEVFLTSREKQIEELETWLKGPKREAEEQDKPLETWREGPTGALVIEARSPAEAIDFVAAYGQDSSRADLFAARTLIVENRDSWRALAALSDGGLLLIPHPSLAIEPEMVAEAVRRGHRVLLSSGLPQREQVATLKLPRAYRHDLETALKTSGLDEERAGRFAREAGGSLTVLKRLLARYPGTTQPDWSRPSEAAGLIPFLLAGSWDENSEADRSAIEQLSGNPYSAAAEVAGRWLKAQDPPIARAGTRWSVVSRDDSWFLLGSSVRPDSLRRFDEEVLKVLAEDDPAFELPPEERWQAGFHRKGPRYSPALRQGLAETLALLGARPERLPDATDVRGLAHQVVRKLLDGQGWLRWASLSYQLPLLAEAAPRAFLEAVEKDLKQTDPALLKLFKQEGDPLFKSNPHTGLLWALEVLAWDRTSLPQVSLVLASLDEKVPKCSSGNSPSRSLLEIFMPWFPQTTAPVAERVGVLRKLVKSRPDAGWRLLLGLLPNQHQISVPTSRPSWRDWALTWSARTTHAEYWHQVGACAHLVVEQLGEDISRWEALIKQFENLPAPVHKEFIERLDSFARGDLDEETRRTLSEALREKVAWHKRFAAADWAMPDEVLAELDRVRSLFDPKDPVRRNAWLFGPRWQVAETLEDQEEKVEESRRAALREIIGQCGWQGVLELVGAVEAPEEIGMLLAGSPEYEAKILPALLASADEKAARFARGYAWGRFSTSSWDWIDRLQMQDWTCEQIGGLLVLLPFERRTWDLAASKGDEVTTWYWEHTPPHYTRDGKDDEARQAIGMLLTHKRPAAAIHVIRMALHDKQKIESGLLMDALEGWLGWATNAKMPDQLHGSKYDLHLVFQALQQGAQREDSSVEIQRLARLEWGFLSLLDGHPASPVTLHGLLRDEPDFFVQVLGLIFRPKGVSAEDAPKPTAEEKLRAQSAYRLLMAWQDVPGLLKDGTVDEKKLSDWISRAREQAEERGLLEVCDSRIGEVFAHAPSETAGSWPCIPIRDALEDIGTEEVFDGFGVGIYNKRGMVSKSMREGGAQERALAEKYRNFAEASHVDWPKTAAALRRVADGYEEHARREDAEAEID